MRVGLGARLALVFASLTIVAIFAMGVVGLVSTRGQVIDDVDAFLEERADELTNGVRSASPREGRDGRRNNGDDNNNNNNNNNNDTDNPEITLDDIDDLVRRAPVDNDAEVQSLNEDGGVVATVGLRLPVDDLDEAIADHDGQLLRTVTVDGESYRMITAHVSGGGAVQVALSIERTNALIGSISSHTLYIALGFAGTAGLIGWFIAQRATQPLRSLTASVEHVARTQDFSRPVDLQRSDEIGRLATGFNQMLTAMQASKIQQTQLVEDAAHELRTPLTSIQANVDLLAHASDLEENERNSMIRGLSMQLRQLNAVVTEIVQLATHDHDPNDHVVVDLAHVAQEAVANFSLRANNPVELRTSPSMVLGDPTALDRVIGNLLSNGEKYGPPGAPLVVTVHAGRLAVIDRGPGIEPADQHRIFDRFYRTRDAQPKPGSGLGLAIVQKIVAEHAGDVFVRSQPPHGSEIGFALPLSG